MANQKDKNILIVDDEPDIREILRELLPLHSCTEAKNGKEGLEKASTQKFDLIITDIQMPELTGIEMLKELRKRGDLTPVLVVSGFGSSDHIRLAWQLGAFDFVDKPFDQKQITSLVRNALEFGLAQAQSWAQAHPTLVTKKVA